MGRTANLAKGPGECSHCSAPAAPGRKNCEIHLAAAREYARRSYEANRDKRRAQMRAYAAQYRIENLDVVGPKERARIRDRYAKWKRAGLCTGCGASPAPGRRTCSGCLERERKYARTERRNRAGTGHCRRCGRDVGDTYCGPCRAKMAAIKAQRQARKRGVESERVSASAVFERDGWRCMICGRATPRSLRGTLRDNAPELDHRVPLSRGGSHTYENVQCACRACNVAKGNRTAAGQIPLWSRPAA